MTEIELLEHVLGNLKAGRPLSHGLLYRGRGVGIINYKDSLSNFDWKNINLYTLAPRTHIVNTFEVPAPESDELEEGHHYYIPCHTDNSGFVRTSWDNDRSDNNRLKNKQVFLTKEAAILNQKSQAGIDPYKWDDE